MRYSSAIIGSALFFAAFFHRNVAAEPQLGDMEPLYVFTPGPAPGNCDKYKPDLLVAFRETIDMLTRSTAAIMFLNVTMPGILHPLRRRKWKAWAQLMKEVFNIDVDTKTGLQLPSGPAQGVLDNFNGLLNAHNYKPPGSVPYQYWFFCNDDFLEFKSPPSAEILDSWDWPPGMNAWRKNIETIGYWNATGGTAAHPLLRYRLPARAGDENAKGYLCSRSDAHAFVIRAGVIQTGARNTVLVFCPAALDGFPYPTVAKLMNDKSFKKPGGSLQSMGTWGTLMAHEWGHLVLDLLDERAVDYFGVDVGTSENPGNIYGWGRVTETARWKPDRVRKTPDAYTMFSMAVYYTEINKWGLQFVTGVGKYWVKS